MSDDPITRLNAALEGRYRIERELGEGGMAVVCLAHDEKHGRLVAIKVLRPELAAAMGPERFLREIEVAARLNHPNILGLHDSGEADGLLYFVMPFVEGGSLRDRLDREGTLSLEDAGRIVREVGSALAYAHDRGLVHRDVKPENILFQAGHALLCDLGIAKATSEAQMQLTHTGISVGTFLYMSPEQASGDGGIDGRADIYALGCTFHEMLSGEPPFRGSTPQAILAKKLMGRIPELSSSRSDVPATVRDVIVKALATSPEDRFSSSEEFVRALEFATTEEAVFRDVRRRRRGRALRASASVVASTVVGVMVWWAASILGAPAIGSVAVLPDPSSMDDPDQAYFAQDVYRELTSQLARAGVRVKSPTSVARFVGSYALLGEIADSLGVDGIVQVSAARVGGRVDIGLSLTEGETEDLVWAASYSGEARYILSMYSDMVRAIAAEIGVRLSAEVEARLARAPEVDPAVQDALAQASYAWESLTEEGFATALAWYDVALQRDSMSAEAWLGLGQVWGLRAQQGLVSTEEANRRAEPALQRAEELDPALSQVQAAVAVRKTWGEWAWEEAEAAFDAALEQNQFDATTRAYYALFLLYQGRADEAAAHAARAAEDEAPNTLVQGLVGQTLNIRGEYEAAETLLLKALELDRGVPFLLSTLRTTYHLMGRHDEALASWRASFTDEGSYTADGDPAALVALDRGYDEHGYEGALRAVAELYVERSQVEYLAPWRIATLYTRAAMKDEALNYLALACFEARDTNCPYLSVEPTYDFLRDDPRFHAVIDFMGLPR